MKINIKKLTESAVLPSYSKENNVVLDIYSDMNCSLEQGQRMAISTGISIEIPDGYVGLTYPISELSKKKGANILSNIIVSTSKEEYKIVLLNTGYDDFIIRKGDKIAQLLIQSVEQIDINEIDELNNSLR